MGNSLKDRYGKLIKEIMINLHESGYLSPKSITYVAETLSDMDITFDYNELQDLFDEYLDVIALGQEETDESLKKKKKIHVNKDAGNVEYNISMFNKGFANAGGEASASCGEELDSHIYNSSDTSLLLEAIDNDDLLLEAGAAYLTGKKMVSLREFIQKLFSADLLPLLLLDPNTLTWPNPAVKNEGGKGTDPVDAAKEDQSNPKPGFSLYGNHGSFKKEEDRYKNSKDTHHVFGFHKGKLSEIKIMLDHDIHSGVHNALWKILYEYSKDKIEDDYEEYKHYVGEINDKPSVIYGNRAGLMLRQLEYTLRKMADSIKKTSANNKKLAAAVLLAEAQALGKFIAEHPAPIFNANNTNLLKIKTNSGKEYEILPIILTSSLSKEDSESKLQSEITRYKLISSDGVYLEDIKSTDTFFMLALVKVDEEDDFRLLLDANDLKYFKEVGDAESIDSFKDDEPKEYIADEDKIFDKETAEQKESLTEAQGDKTFISPALAKKIIENNFLYQLKGLRNIKTGYYGNADRFTGADVFKQIANRIGDIDFTKDRIQQRNLNTALSTVVKRYLDNFYEKFPCEIYIKNFDKDILSLDLDGSEEIQVESKNVEVIIDGKRNELNTAVVGQSINFGKIFDSIAAGQTIDISSACPIFLDMYDKPINGINIELSGTLLVLKTAQSVDLNSVATIDLTKIYSDAELIKLITQRKERFCEILAENIYRFTSLSKVIWDSDFPFKPKQFYGSRATSYENIFSNKVTSLPNEMFKNSRIQKLIIPDYIRSVGEKCFSYCQYLTDIYIPKNCKLGKDALTESNNCTVHYMGTAEEYRKCQTNKWGKTSVRKLILDQDLPVKYVTLTENLDLREAFEDKEDTDADGNKIELIKLYKSPDGRFMIFSPKNYVSYQAFVKKWLKIAKKPFKGSILDPNINANQSTLGSISNMMHRGDKSPLDVQIVIDLKTNELYTVWSNVYSQSLNICDLSGKMIRIENMFDIDESLLDFYLFNAVKDCKAYNNSSAGIFERSYIAKVGEKLASEGNITKLSQLNNANDIKWVDISNVLTHSNGFDAQTAKFILALFSNDYKQLLKSGQFDLDMASEDKMKADLNKVKLSSAIIKELNDAGYEEDDFYKALSNPDDYDELYNSIVNAYQKTNISRLMHDYREDFEEDLNEKGVLVDYKNNKIGITPKSVVNMYVVSGENLWSGDVTRKVLGNDTKNVPSNFYKDLGINNVDLRLFKKNYSTNFWTSMFLPLLEDNLKNLKKINKKEK